MMNKRYLAPVIAGVAVFGAVTAFAAGFNVTSNTVVSGNATVTGCNAAARVSYTTVWGETVAGPKAYVVKTAPVSTAVACKGMDYHVTLQDVDNKSLGEVTGTLDAVTGDAAPDFTSQLIPAADVAGIAITVTG